MNSYRRQAQEREERAINCIRDNPKYFYTYVREKINQKTNLSVLKSNDLIITDPAEIAEEFQTHFKSVFVPDDQINSDTETNENVYNEVKYNVNDIIEAIKTLKTNSCSGKDGIPVKLLKACSTSLSVPLSDLLKCSLDAGSFPEILKSVLITPVHKSSSKLDPKNYRPIALISNISKVFEKVVRSDLMKYFETNDLFNANQHGFRTGRSCLSELLQHYDKLLYNAENNRNTEVIYLDFAKAFDKVNHNILLRKLNKLGIGGKIHSWLKSYLTGRTQQVTICGVKSKSAPVLSGIPQGSVLGPMLFILMMADVDTEMNDVKVSSFADDTKLTKTIENNIDYDNFQNDIDKICKWAKDNKMIFNTNKFVNIKYSNNDNYAIKKYMAEQEEIEIKTSCRDLGIIMSDDLNFDKHIDSMTLRAKQKMQWVLRTFESRERLPMLTLYKSLVLPLLENNSQLWNPSKVKNINLIESIQRTFTASINGCLNLNYWERLSFLSLYSLQRRRERYSIIYVWKIIESIVQNPSSYHFEVILNPRRGRLLKRRQISAVTTRVGSLRHGSFFINGPRLFNCLPAYIRNITGVSASTFKAHLDKFLEQLPDEPPVYCGRNRNSIIEWCEGGSVSNRDI